MTLRGFASIERREGVPCTFHPKYIKTVLPALVLYRGSYPELYERFYSVTDVKGHTIRDYFDLAQLVSTLDDGIALPPPPPPPTPPADDGASSQDPRFGG